MDEQLYLLAVGLSLNEKVEKSIANLREYEKEALRRDPVNGYYLCDSFGKDSSVILHLAKMAGVRFQANHNLTTLDPPELIWFGKKHHPETVIHRPKVPMLVRLTFKNNGPPTRMARWCCAEYKEASDNNEVKIFGVRAAESAKRKANWKTWQFNRNGGWILNPILFWTDEDVWRFIHQENIPYCSLYDEGKKRLGCVGCPMARDGRKDDFKRWPKYEQAWKNSIRKFYETWHGVPTEREHWTVLPGGLALLPGERIEVRWLHVVTGEIVVDGEIMDASLKREVVGFVNRRRWFDLPRPDGRMFTKWEDIWDWWMEENQPEKEDDCQMGLF